jgi:hypothetical protein
METKDKQPLSATRAFVVQFRAPDDVSPGNSTGRVEHISSGQARHFFSLEELCAFMEQVLKEILISGRVTES